jgi:two-component system CitB family sensor kinase
VTAPAAPTRTLRSRYLREVALGYGPEEFKRPFAFCGSALHSLSEEPIFADDSGRLVLDNDEAAFLLGLPELERPPPIVLAEVALPGSVQSRQAQGT